MGSGSRLAKAATGWRRPARCRAVDDVEPPAGRRGRAGGAKARPRPGVPTITGSRGRPRGESSSVCAVPEGEDADLMAGRSETLCRPPHRIEQASGEPRGAAGTIASRAAQATLSMTFVCRRFRITRSQRANAPRRGRPGALHGRLDPDAEAFWGPRSRSPRRRRNLSRRAPAGHRRKAGAASVIAGTSVSSEWPETPSSTTVRAAPQGREAITGTPAAIASAIR